MTSIDIDLDTHAGAQRRQFLVAGIDAHAHRHALHDLHPIAAGILRRQQREFLRRRGTDALHGAVPDGVRISINRHRDRLPGLHISQLRFFRIGADPEMIGVDEIERSRRGGAILGTLVTVPVSGALTTVWSSSRCASSTCACACKYCGCCAVSMSALPPSRANCVAACCRSDSSLLLSLSSAYCA